MIFAFGEYAIITESMSDDEVKEVVMTNLRTIYGYDIPESINFTRSKWISESFVKGSYSASIVGLNNDEFSSFSDSIGDKVFFAGEHTSQDYRGTVHGAYLSAENVFNKISKLIG